MRRYRIGKFILLIIILASVTGANISQVRGGTFNGVVIKGNAVDVSIRLESAASLREGDRIDLSYMAGVMEMLIGTYEVSSVRGRDITARIISSSMPPGDGMEVIIRSKNRDHIPKGDGSVTTGVEGEVVEVSGTDVKIRLSSQGGTAEGDMVRLVYVTSSGMKIEVGRWEVTGKEDGLVTAKVVESATKPRKGLRAFIEIRKPVKEGTAGIPVSQKGHPGKKEPAAEESKGLFSSDYGREAGVDIQGIQEGLKKLGYDPGPADGKMGEMTRLAIVQYQRERGLEADGIPSAELQERLYSETLSIERETEGTPEAEHQRGMDYFYGRNGMPKDYARAAAHFRKAAEKGHSGSQNHLGVIYGKGLGVQQDYKEAVKWYRSSADNGDAKGYYNLGVMYANGTGVPKDYVEAAVLFRIAAEKGDASAQHNLAVLFKNGWGVSQDYNSAILWFRKASDQNLAASQHALGLMYEEGLGVAKNEATAVKFFRMAAVQGFSSSQEKLKKRGLKW